MSYKPLQGITVVDLSRLLPGPFCSLILSDLGARVIKIEDTDRGDYLREIPPTLDDHGGALYYALNRYKENICLDLRTKKGKDVLKRLVKKADVLLESNRPGVMKRLGLSYSTLKSINPKIIMASITGYGQDGPYKDCAGHDLNYMSLAGLITSSEVPHVQWADLVGGGLWAAFSIIVSLFQRTRTKKGMYLDVAMTDAMSFIGFGQSVLQQLGVNKTILDGILARYKIYETEDHKYVSLAALESKFWSRFCDLIDKPQWKDQISLYQDISPEIHHELSEIFKRKKQDEWKALSRQHDICLTPVLNSQEVPGSDQFQNRGFFLKASSQKGEVILPTLPLWSCGLKNKKLAQPKKRGADTILVLKELGYSQDQIKSLLNAGVVRSSGKE